MLIVVSYDLADDRRRNRLSEMLQDFGERVQFSVFECHLTLAEVEELRARVARAIDTSEDRVRIYRFCEDCGTKGEVLGPGKRTEDPEVYVLRALGPCLHYTNSSRTGFSNTEALRGGRL